MAGRRVKPCLLEWTKRLPLQTTEHGINSRSRTGKLRQIAAGMAGMTCLRHVFCRRGLRRHRSRLRFLCGLGSGLRARSGRRSGRRARRRFGGSGSGFGFPLTAIDFVDPGSQRGSAGKAQWQNVQDFHKDSPAQAPSYLAQAFLARKSTLINFSINFTERRSFHWTTVTPPDGNRWGCGGCTCGRRARRPKHW